MIERTRFNSMNELSRLTGGGHKVKPPPRSDLIVAKIENAPRQQIAAAEIVDQPAVEAELLQSGLDFAKVEHGYDASYSNRTARVSISRPVGIVSDWYSSGRRALVQRTPVQRSRNDASKSATTMSSRIAFDSPTMRP